MPRTASEQTQTRLQCGARESFGRHTRTASERAVRQESSNDVDYQRIASCKASRSWLRQSGITMPKAACILALESTELRGLRAGVKYCSDVIPTTRLAFSGPPNSPLSAGQASRAS